jgi:hypothetical protein
MSTPAILEDTRPSGETDPTELGDRIHRLEGEVAELRHTLSELAELVVGDIKERREIAAAVSAPMPEVPIPASIVPGGQAALNTAGVRRPWLLIDVLREIGVTFHMYMDPRYRVRRATQLMVPLIFGLFALNYAFFNLLLTQVPVLTPILERLIGIILAVLLYKVISRETTRYRQMVATLSVGPRASAAVPVSLWNTDPDTAAVTRQESP